uniref:UDP glucuronosyltransferase family 2 member A3 n=1 Tax=Ursus americanus TaxID=9643 RepID=A0A452RR39_URSAM
MVAKEWISAIVLLQLCYTGCGLCGKVLVWPCDMSHWLNLKIVLEELTERGHEVTVLVSPESFIIDYSKASTLKFEVVPMPPNREKAEKTLNDFLDVATNVMPTLSVWQSAMKLQEFFLQVTENLKLLCESVIYNQSLMKKLQETKYDVMVIDPVVPCGELIAELLTVPFVYTLRVSIGNTVEKYCGKLPVPLSYVPVALAGLTDRMTFLQRVKNVMFFILSNFWIPQMDTQVWNQFYSEALDYVGKQKFVLIRSIGNFEFLVHTYLILSFVGGLLCKPEMEEFVQSSGERWCWWFSLGSMVKNLTDEKPISLPHIEVPQKVKNRTSL